MADYNLLFAVFLLINVLLTIRASSLYSKFYGLCFSSSSSVNAASSDAQSLIGSTSSAAVTNTSTTGSIYKKLLASYLLVYLLATLSDWLQGPYVYALYAAYGYTKHQIAVLFVAGFGSSECLLHDSCSKVTDCCSILISLEVPFVTFLQVWSLEASLVVLLTLAVERNLYSFSVSFMPLAVLQSVSLLYTIEGINIESLMLGDIISTTS
jgi:hypothetical protein